VKATEPEPEPVLSVSVSASVLAAAKAVCCAALSGPCDQAESWPRLWLVVWVSERSTSVNDSEPEVLSVAAEPVTRGLVIVCGPRASAAEHG